MSEPLTCSRCGTRLGHGVPSWTLRIELSANFDGTLDCSLKAAREADRTIEAVLRQIEWMDAETLENQIYQFFEFVLCRDCRDHYSANPLFKM